VTERNIEELQAAVRLGMTDPRGARLVEHGRTKSRQFLTRSSYPKPTFNGFHVVDDVKIMNHVEMRALNNTILEVGDVVEIFLRSGSLVTFNRQPSLKPCSIQGRRSILDWWTR
jgi:hypothetical protein